ncbi:MAG: hypothetical protein KA712_08025 [Myxococcales bacterium]|nr:hypothetical protein [Myxococcales bacterium]
MKRIPRTKLPWITLGAWGAAWACQPQQNHLTTAPAPDASARADAETERARPDADESLDIQRGTIPVTYEPSPWLTGTTTRARFGLISVQTRHDGPFGRSRIEMEYTDGSGRARIEHEQFGRWRLFGYVPERKSYIVGGAWEQGAFEPYGAMAYLDEATGEVKRWQDERTWYAFAAVPSPDLRFVALVGSLEAGYRVLLWNTISDRLFDVARAPAPPPMSARDCTLYASREGHDWGFPVDAVVEMDPGIVSFSATHVEVSYGRDTCRARAKRRVRKAWALANFQ